MFAPHHHAAMRYVIPVRRELAVRTVMNFLGPLTSPAGVTRQLTGVADRRYHDTIAGAFARLGAKHALIVSSEDGLDELSTVAPTRVLEVRDGAISEWTVSAADVGLDAAPYEELTGGGPQDNAAIARRILDGERGAPRDIAVLNAGAGIYASGRADTLEAGVRLRRGGDRQRRRAQDLGAVRRQQPRSLHRHEQRARTHRRRHPTRRGAASQRGADRGAGALAAGSRRGPSLRGGARPPRHLRDRGAQAPLAVGRPDPRGRRRSRRSWAPTSAPAPPRCRC